MKFYNRVAAMTLSAVMLLGTATQASAAYLSNGTYYDTESGEHWSQPYADHLYEQSVMTAPEYQDFEPHKAVTARDAIALLLRTQDKVDSINQDRVSIRSFESVLPEGMSLDETIDRGDLAMLVYSIADDTDLYDMNIVAEGSIPDVDVSDAYYESVYALYRWGLVCGIDMQHNYGADIGVTQGVLAVVADRVLNPDARESLAMYEDDAVLVQSETYPMSYVNEDKGLNIEITKERHFESDCYVAHVTMKDPSHLKTTYSYMKWDEYGLGISEVNERVDAILMVNGDFRRSDFGEDLGIIRGRHVVNNKTVNGIGLYMDGRIEEIKKKQPGSLLDAGVRETWTFGPVLLRDGVIIPKQDDTKHPRTFIGQVDRDDDILEYYIVVADGRWYEREQINGNWEWVYYSMGLSNYEMASVLRDKGCDFGYNLDGGGSTVMMFDGKVLNRPSDGEERNDADYLYIK